jgi:pimeloyl-ACP methyl ester carboxylesterase
VLTRQSGPTILAAHSYGGQVITARGTDAPNVVGLVYIAGFGLDEGESIGALLKQGPPPPAVANIDVDSESFAWIPEDDFPRAPVRNRPALLERTPLALR